MRSILAAQAMEDLDDITILIARRDGITSALAFMDKVEDFALGLSDHPHIGTLMPQLGEGVRKIGFRKQVTLFFFIENDDLIIARITYAGAQEPVLVL